MLARLSAIPSIVRYVGSGEVWSHDRVRAVHDRNLEHWRRHGFGWRAAVETAERPAGRTVIALNFPGEGKRGLEPSEYEIGWWLDPAAQGRGLAREGALAIRDEARDRLGAPGVVARIQSANRASIAVAEAIGLELDAISTGAYGEPVALYRGVLQNHSNSV